MRAAIRGAAATRNGVATSVAIDPATNTCCRSPSSRPAAAATPASTNENSPVCASESPVRIPSRGPMRSAAATIAATSPDFSSTTLAV
jgi:hypothetical protein